MTNPAPIRRRLVITVLGAVAASALSIMVLTHWWVATPPAPEPGDAMAAALDRLLARDRSPTPGVAIRPLAAASAPAEAVSLADAVCAALAERLLRVSHLRVVPCRSTAAAVAGQLDDRSLARLLAVQHVLVGDVQPLPGERLRVRLSLREPAAARDAWQLDEQFATGELQTLPDRVAFAMSAAIGQPDSAAPQRHIAPALYEKFIVARQLAQNVSVDKRLRAVELLDEVLAAEPEHASALYVRHSVLGTLIGVMPGPRPSAAELDAARAAHASQDLVLAERIWRGDAHDFRPEVLRLMHEMEVKQWPQGFERIDRIVERHARVPGLLRMAARQHLHVGYLARAEELARAAARLNALDAEALEILAAVAGMQRRDTEFRELLALARQIGHTKLGPLQVFDAHRRGDWAELERAYAAYVAWGGSWPSDWVPQYARGVADRSQRDAAIRVLDAHDEGMRQHFSGFQIEYALLGDAQRSLRSVQHHARRAPSSWMQFLWWPELAAVRQQPGFAEAMRDLGAVALWEARGAPDLCAREAAGTWRCR